jgi:hypothetical protein
MGGEERKLCYELSKGMRLLVPKIDGRCWVVRDPDYDYPPANQGYKNDYPFERYNNHTVDINVVNNVIHMLTEILEEKSYCVPGWGGTGMEPYGPYYKVFGLDGMDWAI